MRDFLPNRTCAIYIEPPSQERLFARLSGRGETNQTRFTEAARELLELGQGVHAGAIDFCVTSNDNQLANLVGQVRAIYYNAIGQHT